MFDAERARRPWHRGEAAAQRLAVVEAPPPVIRPFMSEQLRQFFPQLSLLLLAAVDADGFPSATFVRGARGFIACPEPTRMEIDATLFDGDPLATHLRRDCEVGLLGVDFRTRRRNRVNGRVESLEAGRVTIMVAEAFGNCPKYIRQRETVDALTSAAPRRWEPLDGLDAAVKDAIANAETFFIASIASCDWGGRYIPSRGPAGLPRDHRRRDDHGSRFQWQRLLQHARQSADPTESGPFVSLLRNGRGAAARRGRRDPLEGRGNRFAPGGRTAMEVQSMSGVAIATLGRVRLGGTETGPPSRRNQEDRLKTQQRQGDFP